MPVSTDRPLYSQSPGSVFKIVGKILRKNYQPFYTLGATYYQTISILSEKILAFRLDY